MIDCICVILVFMLVTITPALFLYISTGTVYVLAKVLSIDY